MTTDSKLTNNAGSKNIFESAFAFLPDPTILIDTNLRLLEANQAYLNTLKTTIREIRGKHFFSFIRDGEAELKQIQQSLILGITHQDSVRFEAFITTGANGVMPAIVNIHFFEYQGESLGICTITPTSSYQKTQDKINSLAEFQQIFSNKADDLIQLTAADGSIQWASKKWLDCLGYRHQDLPNLNIADIIREDHIPQSFRLLDRVKKGDQLDHIETIFKSKDGTDIYVEGNLYGIFEAGKCVSIRGLFRDITRSKVAEEIYRRLVHDFPMPVFIVQKGIYRFVNPSFLSITEYSENELIGSESLALVHPEDMVYVQTNSVRILKTQRPSSYEYRLIRKSGELRWVMETAISIPYEGGNACLGTLVDLTERKLSEDALQESKNRYQNLFNCSSDSIYIVDMQYRFLEANNAACKLLGYSKAEYLSRTLQEIASPKLRKTFEQGIQLLIEKGELIAEVESVHRDGSIIPTEVHSKLVEYENKKAILVVSRDISDRKQIEILNKRSQDRLESLVRIAQLNSGDTRDLLDFALEEALKLTDSKMGYIYFYDEQSGNLTLISLNKEIAHILNNNAPILIPLETTSVLGRALIQKDAVINNLDHSQKPGLMINGYPEGPYLLDRFMTLPIGRGEHTAVIIGVANREENYNQSDAQQLKLFMDSVCNILERWQVEQALRESEHRYRQIIELSQDGIIRMDENGIIVMANPSVCAMFGFSEQELVSQPLSITYPPEEHPLTIEYSDHLHTSGPTRFERLALRKDGTRIPIEVSISPLTNGHYQEIIRDIATRKKMEEELQNNERKYRLLVENQTDLMIELDIKGKLLFANPSYCKLIWKAPEEVMATSFFAVIHPDDKERIQKELERVYFPPYTAYVEHRLLTRDDWRWIAWSVNAVLDNSGDVMALTCIGRDITDSKEAKEELEKANQRLRELDKLKDNFLSTVSHELRTPLTSIKSFTEILLNYEEDRTTQIEFLGIINEESDRLTRLINDFLDLSKIQAGRMKWQAVELSIAEAINSAANAAKPLIDKAKLDLNIQIEPDLPKVLSDRDRLIQVITNLLGNAIKFTPERGTIQLMACSDTDTDSDQRIIKVSITDSGIGIAPENHQLIFENFGQVGDVLKDRPKGTGLGLPICKKIIENFGGKIWVKSALGKGTTFIFTLPAVGIKLKTTS
jgi:PAS domain S-box-containing protein